MTRRRLLQGTPEALAPGTYKRVQAVEVVNAHHVRFRLHEPWPDFLTFYGTIATGAGWIVPKKYIEKIGNDAFKNQPIGLGPYRRSTFGV